MFIADVKVHMQIKIKILKLNATMILQYNIEYIIFTSKYKSQPVDYNKIENMVVEYGSSQYKHIIPPRPNIRINRYCTFTYRR